MDVGAGGHWGTSPFAALTGYDERLDPYAHGAETDNHGGYGGGLQDEVWEERVQQCLHWFRHSFGEGQQNDLLFRLLQCCSPAQLALFGDAVGAQAALKRQDFTQVLPRALSLRVFRFLDPRSLSRAAQVSWHWKAVSEHKAVWRRMCTSQSWFLPYQPSPLESGVWKAHYLRCVAAVYGVGTRAAQQPTVAELPAAERTSLSRWGTHHSTMQEHSKLLRLRSLGVVAVDDIVPDDDASDYGEGEVTQVHGRDGFDDRYDYHDRHDRHDRHGDDSASVALSALSITAHHGLAEEDDGATQRSGSAQHISVDSDLPPWKVGPFRSQAAEQASPANTTWARAQQQHSLTKGKTQPPHQRRRKRSGTSKAEPWANSTGVRYMSDALPESSDVIIQRQYREASQTARGPDGYFGPEPDGRHHRHHHRYRDGAGDTASDAPGSGRGHRREHRGRDRDRETSATRRGHSRDRGTSATRRGHSRDRSRDRDREWAAPDRPGEVGDLPRSGVGTQRVAELPGQEAMVRAPLIRKTIAFDHTVPEIVSDHRYPRVICISSEVPARHLLLVAARFDVVAIPYDYEATSCGILGQRIERALQGRRARSVAFVCDGGPGRIRLAQNDTNISVKAMRSKTVREFFETLGTLIVPETAGGRVDLFVGHVSESAQGQDLLSMLQDRIGVRTFASDDVVGSPQDLDWVVEGREQPQHPIARLYFNATKLESWRCVAETMGDTVQAASVALAPLVHKFQVETTNVLAGEVLESVLSVGGTALVVEAAPRITEALAHLLASDTNPSEVDQALATYFTTRRRSIAKQQQRTQARRGRSDDDHGDEEEESEGAAPEEGRHDGQGSMGDAKSFFHWPVVAWDEPEPLGVAQLRENLVGELLRTETHYVHSLKCLQELYVDPLRTLLLQIEEEEEVASQRRSQRSTKSTVRRGKKPRQPKKGRPGEDEGEEDRLRPLISRSSYRTIFDKVKALYPVHTKLAATLRDRALRWSDDQCLGDVFVQLAAHFKLYATLSGNMEAMLNTLEACMGTSWAFRAFVCQARHNPASVSRTLPELLLEPMRRVSQYYQILYRIKSLTPEHHRDYLNLCDACSTLMQIDRRIRKAKTSTMRAEEASVINGSIERAPDLFSGNREFIVSDEFVQLEEVWVEGDAEEVRPQESWRSGRKQRGGAQTRQLRPVQDVGLFLFNDTLVVTLKLEHRSAFGRSFTTRDVYDSRLPLETMMVSPVVDSPGLDHVFEVRTPKRTLFFKCASRQRRTEWLEQMLEAMKGNDPSS